MYNAYLGSILTMGEHQELMNTEHFVFLYNKLSHLVENTLMNFVYNGYNCTALFITKSLLNSQTISNVLLYNCSFKYNKTFLL